MGRRLVPTLWALGLLAAACGGGGPAAAPVRLGGQTNNQGTAAAKDDLRVSVDDFAYSPTFIRAKAGKRFTIELTNDGNVRHTFTSQSLGIDLELAPGAQRTVTVAAPASGFSEFHCRFHQGQGMQGAVFVR